MKIDIKESELGLCIAALELGSKELREGIAASSRLALPMPDGLTEIADEMEALKSRLLSAGVGGT